jgi:hypothetical protein
VGRVEDLRKLRLCPDNINCFSVVGPGWFQNSNISKMKMKKKKNHSKKK